MQQNKSDTVTCGEFWAVISCVILRKEKNSCLKFQILATEDRNSLFTIDLQIKFKKKKIFVQIN